MGKYGDSSKSIAKYLSLSNSQSSLLRNDDLSSFWNIIHRNRNICKKSRLFLDLETSVIRELQNARLLRADEIPKNHKLCFPCISLGKFSVVKRESSFLSDIFKDIIHIFQIRVAIALQSKDRGS